MVRRWATLRRAVQNSAEVATSTQSVRIASETSSPPPTRLDPLFVALRQLSKKYLALPLWMTSYRVPAATRTAITMTYACMTAGSMDAESSAKGLWVSMDLVLRVAVVRREDFRGIADYVQSGAELPPRIPYAAITSAAGRRFRFAGQAGNIRPTTPAPRGLAPWK